ncbi:MAG: hydroxyphenylacetyl-CoA thioesterase PaaI [Kiloniellales bacterium]|nr:hydroxyphenylacetyl-CoA thioesterase PaaI [Kiloniellales bacterium]MDJ0980504.1 hydroxyphenylacetyl-CoA thioesterase PaaI [Kiloniellales bacterium]
MTITPEELAERCAEAMWRDDQASQALGMSLDAVGPGTATLSMTVTDSMINGHEICHGGLIFTLADSAFAFACNAYNKVTVAQHCSVTFLAPARLGDRLTARAEERSLNGRSGIYDIRVDNQDGKAIAEFRGHSRTIKGHLVPELAAEETT